jgi:hypothetical protein
MKTNTSDDTMESGTSEQWLSGPRPSNCEIIYSTGCTPDGVILVGGVWTLWNQEGFPLEMSHIICIENGWAIDWMEAMADASQSNDCPSLMKSIETFLPEQTLSRLKTGFIQMVSAGKPFNEVVDDKRNNGRKMDAFIQSAVGRLYNPKQPNIQNN